MPKPIPPEGVKLSELPAHVVEARRIGATCIKNWADQGRFKTEWTGRVRWVPADEVRFLQRFGFRQPGSVTPPRKPENKLQAL